MNIEPIYYLYCFLAFIGAGLVQAITGFGAGIFVMIFLPLFLPVTLASSLSMSVGMFLCLAMAWQYRKHADFKSALLPALANIILSTVCVWLSVHVIDLSGLKMYLGLFLILVAIWMAFFASKVRIRPTPGNALLCGSLSGIASGFFSTGGPPMVVYYLSAYGDDMLTYLGTFQFFSVMNNVVNLGVRALNGTVPLSLLPLIVPGLAGIFLGKLIGQRIVDRIRVDQMKKLIYAFLAFSGLVTFLSNLG